MALSNPETGKTLFVDNAETLHFLRTSYWNSKIHGSPFSGITIHFKNITPPRAQIFQAELNDYYFECGCGMGSIFLALAILFLVILPFVSGVGYFPLSWKGVAAGLGIFIGSALFGKLLGLTRSYLKLIQVISQIRSSLRETGA